MAKEAGHDVVVNDAVPRKGIRGDEFWAGRAKLADRREGKGIGSTEQIAKDKALEDARAKPAKKK